MTLDTLNVGLALIGWGLMLAALIAFGVLSLSDHRPPEDR